MSVNASTDPAGAKEFRDAQQTVRASRRAFQQSADSAFVRTMQHAVQQYLDARAQGVSRADACRGLELELREAWPHKPTKFPPVCDACSDTGYVDLVCSDASRCQRPRCQQNHPAWEHAYVEPCHCPAGDKKKRRAFTPEDAIAAATRMKKKKPGGWRQVGA